MNTPRGERYRVADFKPGWVVKVNEWQRGSERDPKGTNVLRVLKICTVDVRRVDRIWFTVEDTKTGDFEVKSLGTISLYEVERK